MVRDAAQAAVDVEGRRVRVSHLDRLLWPAAGVVKGDLVDYYLRVAEMLLPHIAGRPVTLHRFPEGVGGPHFFQTRCPPHPAWLRTATLSYPRTGKTFDVAVLDDRPSLVWAANLAAIEIHPFLSRADAFDRPTWVVADLDPGVPASIVDAAEVALLARAHLEDAGLQPVVKTSGGKGLHVYARLPDGASYAESKALARALADGLAARRPDRVVTTMTRARRAGRVLVDWSQNDPGKSTVAPYSLRGGRTPTVSTPVTWDEVARVVRRPDAAALSFAPRDVLERIERHGDLFAAALG
jgi:bifunctional non-homologous end joining protein LigD